MSSPAPLFRALGVPADLCSVLDQIGIDTPSAVQAAVLADALAGRDVAGRAPTGSGKTLAFGLPLVARLTEARRRRPTALVLSPTRELAGQIATALRPFVRQRGHDLVAVYGGVGYGPQRRALDHGVDLLIACPGRLEDLISSGDVVLSDVNIVVVDEADRMADMGFLPAVRRLVAATSVERQVMLFSATFDKAVGTLSKELQRDAVRHEVGATEPDVSNAQHVFWTLPSTDRLETTASTIDALGATIVFCRTRHGADRVVRQLSRLGHTSAALHGGRSQSQRDRALQAFSRGEIQSLIATDVAARGVHVDGVAAVVHFDPPADASTYIHRSGRTARAGATGVVVSLIDPTGTSDARKMQRGLGIEADITPVRMSDVIGSAPTGGAVIADRTSARPEPAEDRQPEHRARRPHPAGERRDDNRPLPNRRNGGPGNRRNDTRSVSNRQDGNRRDDNRSAGNRQDGNRRADNRSADNRQDGTRSSGGGRHDGNRSVSQRTDAGRPARRGSRPASRTR